METGPVPISHFPISHFSRGMQLVLQTCPETIEKLNELSIPHVIEETNAAVATYNRMVNEGKAVGGLFHSTC